MEKTLIIGVMGGGNAEKEQLKSAEKLGALIAEKGWILLNGGRNAGIMEASAKGAAENGGLTLGILPESSKANMSAYIKIPIVTGMGNARNCINVLSSDVIVACPGGAGTISEIALALKSGKPVILFNFNPGTSFDDYKSKGKLFSAQTPCQVIDKILDIARG